MSEQIAVRIADEDLVALDESVANGSYPNRAAAIRAGIHLVLRQERERRITAAYEQAYGDRPQDDWFAESSAQAMGEMLARRAKRGR
jgi:Arc/MetJ-type ribon-helix-helix transcriptional regulator